LLIVVLALMSGACASARPEYYLVPPVSVTASETPRPPAEHKDADVVIDDVEVTWPEGMEPEATPRPPLPVSTSNNLKGKLNKGLAPYIKLDWSAGNKQQSASPTKASVPELQQQVQNLLAQINSRQENTDNRGRAKLERYARELGDTKAELKIAQAERDKALSDYILSKQETESLKKKITKVRSLKAMKDGGDMQWWVITEGYPEGWSDDLRREFLRWMSDLFFLIAIVFTFFLGRWRGKTKAEGVASARLVASEDAIKGRSLYIKELRDSIAKKDHHITELEELVKHGFLSRNPEVEDPLESVPIESPEAVFGPLERDDGK
jgi:hypothetical protein